MCIQMILRQTVRVICLAAICGASHAAESWHISTIKSIYPQPNGAFVLTFDTDAADCANSSHYHYVWVSQNGMTDEGAKKMYAAAMMAMAMDKTVQVAFDNSSNNCYVNRLAVVK